MTVFIILLEDGKGLTERLDERETCDEALDTLTLLSPFYCTSYTDYPTDLITLPRTVVSAALCGKTKEIETPGTI